MGGERNNQLKGNRVPRRRRKKLIHRLILIEAKPAKRMSAGQRPLLICLPMTNLEAQLFNDSARYALMLAEQLQQQAVRENILKLVRVWLATARDAERCQRYFTSMQMRGQSDTART